MFINRLTWGIAPMSGLTRIAYKLSRRTDFTQVGLHLLERCDVSRRSRAHRIDHNAVATALGVDLELHALCGQRGHERYARPVRVVSAEFDLSVPETEWDRHMLDGSKSDSNQVVSGGKAQCRRREYRLRSAFGRSVRC